MQIHINGIIFLRFLKTKAEKNIHFELEHNHLILGSCVANRKKSNAFIWNKWTRFTLKLNRNRDKFLMSPLDFHIIINSHAFRFQPIRTLESTCKTLPNF